MKKLILLFIITGLSINFIIGAPDFTSWSSYNKGGVTVRHRIQADIIDDGYALFELEISVSGTACASSESIEVILKENDALSDPEIYNFVYVFTVEDSWDGYNTTFQGRALIDENSSEEGIFADVHVEGIIGVYDVDFTTPENILNVWRNGDDFDPNESVSTAHDVSGTNVSYFDLICDNDFDFFRTQITTAFPILKVELSYLDDYIDALNLDFYVFNSSGNVVAQGTSSTKNQSDPIVEMCEIELPVGYYYIRISPHAGLTVKNFYDLKISTHIPSIAVNAPVSSNNWQMGSTQNILWSDNTSANVSIYLYNGSSNVLTIASTTASDGSFSWTLPTNLTAGSNYRVYMVSISNSNVNDFSDYFSITSPPSINLTNPTSTSSWQQGSTQNINWSDNIADNVGIYLYNGTSNVLTIAASTASDGSQSWTLPSDLAAGSNYRIYIVSTGNSSVNDYSDYFTVTSIPSIVVSSPTSSSSWQQGSTQNITWSDNIADNVGIYLYNGTSNVLTIAASTASDGSQSWTLPSDLAAGGNYRIYIVSTGNSSVNDYSDYFTVTSLPSIVVSSPASSSSWQQGSTQNITWSDNIADNVGIYLYNGTSNLLTIAASTASDGSQSWTLPSDLAAGSNYRIYIVSTGNNSVNDYSDYFTVTSIPSIVVSSPTSSSSWQQGSTQNITWSDNIADNVGIYLYNGTSNLLTIAASTASDGSQSWTLPSDLAAGSNYRIYIVSTGNSSVNDYSDYFTITSIPSIVVSSPASSSSWQQGSTQNITWSDNIADNVGIYLYNGTSNLLTIAASTASDGSQSWTLPSDLAAGSNYRIYIVSTGNSSVNDYSDYFTITSIPSIVVSSPTSSSSWLQGSTQNITWSDNIAENVNIYLYNGTSNVLTIASSTISDGIHSWILPTELSYGVNYRIYIVSSTGNSVNDYSEYFTIGMPPNCIDSYESNNTIAAANNSAFNSLNASSYSKTISATINNSTDYDYYLLDITTNGNLTITMPNPPLDYDMMLFDASGNQLAVSNSTSSETMTYQVNSSGTYYIYVYGFNGASSCTPYSLSVQWSPEIYLIINGLPIFLSSANGSHSSFSISSNTSWSISDNASWLTISPDNGINDGIIEVTTNSANTEASERTATVQVSGAGVATQTFNITQPSAGLPNLTRIASASLNISGTNVSLSGTVNNTGTGAAPESYVGYYLMLSTSVSSSDILIGNCLVPALAPGAAGNHSLTRDVLSISPSVPAGTYYIGYRIDYLNTVSESNENDNSFYFSQQQITVENCSDSFEPNNTPGAANSTAFATALGSSSYSNSISSNISSTADWDIFRINATVAGSLTMTINNPPADLYLELFDGNQNFLKRSDNPGSEQIIYSIATTGSYYIVIGSSNNQYSCSNYSLLVNWAPSSTCSDSYEPNNNIDNANTTAFPVNFSTSSYSRSVAGNINQTTDWDIYRINTTAVGSLTLAIDNPPADLYMDLYDMNQNFIRQSNNHGSEQIVYNVNTTGYYYIVIGSSNNEYSCSNYTLDVNWSSCSVPSAPVVNASDGSSCGNVSVTWSAISGATSYDVYRSTTFLGNTTATAYTDNNAGTISVQYRVIAKNSCGNSSEGTDMGYRSEGPSAPVVNASDGANCNYVSISWNSISGATSYDVYRETDFLANTTSTSFNDAGQVFISTLYKVIAKSSCGNSPEGSDYGYRSSVPVAPVVSASDGNHCESVAITWNAVSGATSYDIYRGTAFLANTAGTSFNDVGQVFSPTQYKVIAKGSCGDSPAGSDYGNRSPAPVAPVLSASDGNSCESVSLSWNNVAGATSYDVYRGTVFLVNTTNNAFQDIGQVYTSTEYRVIAKGLCGDSPAGTDHGYRSSIPNAPILTASDGNSCESVHLSWNAVDGADSYDVYRGSTFLINTKNTSYEDMGASTAVELYKVTARNSCGISTEGNDIGHKATPPAINIGEDISVNKGSTVTLDAGSGFASYQWSNNATSSSVTILMSNPGEFTYSVRISDHNGCADTDTIRITVLNVTSLEKDVHTVEYKLYPNPSTGDAYVFIKSEMNVPEFDLSIQAMNGALIKKQTISTQNGPVYRLDFDPVPGTYNITILYGDQIIQDKLVIR